MNVNIILRREDEAAHLENCFERMKKKRLQNVF